MNTKEGVEGAVSAPARTKLVFLYSDEEGDGDEHADGEETTKLTTGAVVVRAVADDIMPDAATLAELAASAAEQAKIEEDRLREAEAAGAELPALPPLPDFAEDLVGEGSGAAIPVAGGVRVRVVEADGLVVPRRDGRPRRLTLQEVQESRLLAGAKRFRGDGEGDEDEDEGETTADAAPSEFPPSSSPTGGDEGGVVRTEGDLDAVVLADDGTTVAAVRRHGYLLSVDEADFMDPAAWGHEEEEEEGQPQQNTVDSAEDDEDGEDEEDEEEDEGLDDALFVAIVEQLVRCCEGDDLDPTMAREAERFLAEAKPPLAELEAGTIDESAFVAKLDGSVRRFHRIFKAVYRPRDKPIVVDGIPLDM